MAVSQNTHGPDSVPSFHNVTGNMTTDSKAQQSGEGDARAPSFHFVDGNLRPIPGAPAPLPCAFCGEIANVEFIGEGEHDEGPLQTVCTTCRGIGPAGHTHIEAAQRWNWRGGPDLAQDADFAESLDRERLESLLNLIEARSADKTEYPSVLRNAVPRLARQARALVTGEPFGRSEGAKEQVKDGLGDVWVGLTEELCALRCAFSAINEVEDELQGSVPTMNKLGSGLTVMQRSIVQLERLTRELDELRPALRDLPDASQRDQEVADHD